MVQTYNNVQVKPSKNGRSFAILVRDPKDKDNWIQVDSFETEAGAHKYAREINNNETERNAELDDIRDDDWGEYAPAE